MSQTFFLTINGFRELKRLRWLVWLIIYGYFRHRVTASTLGLLSRTMIILLFCCGCCCSCCSLSRGWKEKPTSFCLVLDIFICLPKQPKNNSLIINSYCNYSISYFFYNEEIKENVFSLFLISKSAYMNFGGCLS